MSIYIRRVDEFDIRKYRPSDANFNVQDYINWVMSHTGEGQGAYISNAEQDANGNLILTYTEYGVDDSYTTVSDGEFLCIQSIPDYGGAIRKIAPEDITNQFVLKP